MNVHSHGWACDDCLFLLANGDTPPEWSEEQTADWLAEIERRGEGLDVTLGGEHEPFCPNVLWECADCLVVLTDEDQTNDGECPVTSRPWHTPRYREWLGTTDCQCETEEFSWSSCDVCGSHLGGSRHAVTYFVKARPTTSP